MENSFSAISFGIELSRHIARAGYFLVVRTFIAVVGYVFCRRFQERYCNAICHWLEDMGPAYIKFGQICSTRINTLPMHVTDNLRRLQDDSRPCSSKQVAEFISEFNEKFRDHISWISHKPIACGSVAQVHYACLSDGREVVIKFMRPHAYEDTVIAMNIFRFGARIISLLPNLRRIPLVDAFEEIKRAVLLQFDFRREVNMNSRLQDMFSKSEEVIIPRPIIELCTESAIVLEYVPQLVKASDLSNPNWLESSIRTAFRAMYKMVLSEGVIHCDFHEGNVFFQPSGRVVILDTGFMEVLDDRQTFQFREFFLGVVLGDGPRCAKILIDTASDVGVQFSRDRFENEICSLISRHSRVNSSEFKVANFATQLFIIQNRNALRGSSSFTLAILSFLVFEGIASKFVADLDFQKEAMPILGPLMVRRSFHVAW